MTEEHLPPPPVPASLAGQECYLCTTGGCGTVRTIEHPGTAGRWVLEADRVTHEEYHAGRRFMKSALLAGQGYGKSALLRFVEDLPGEWIEFDFKAPPGNERLP